MSDHQDAEKRGRGVAIGKQITVLDKQCTTKERSELLTAHRLPLTNTIFAHFRHF